jgi:hypothetical protein
MRASVHSARSGKSFWECAEKSTFEKKTSNDHFGALNLTT